MVFLYGIIIGQHLEDISIDISLGQNIGFSEQRIDNWKKKNHIKPTLKLWSFLPLWEKNCK